MKKPTKSKTRKPPGYFLPEKDEAIAPGGCPDCAKALKKFNSLEDRMARRGNFGIVPLPKTCPTHRQSTNPLPTDTQFMDILSSLWDSQGDGAKICGRFFPNPTGSFRAAVASFYENEIKKSKR